MEIELSWIVAPVIGGIVTLFGWLGSRLYKSIGHRINNAHNDARLAAKLANDVEERRRDDTKTIYASLNEHIRRDEDMHGRVLEAMHAQTSKLGDIHTALVRDLGERPTRAEVGEMIELHQGGRRS